MEQNPDTREFVFNGQYKLTIDEKSRLLVPAEVRRAIANPQLDGEAFFMVIGQNHKLWFYPDKYYQRVAARYRSGMFVQEDILEFKLLHFGSAQRVEWDRQGRMVIPQESLEEVGLGRRMDVTLVGADEHLELWHRDEWASFVKELAKRRKEIMLKADQAQKGATTG